MKPAAWKFPSCIYSPRTTDELAQALKILRSSNTKFAVRGSGHSPLSGWANIDNKVLISMSQFNSKEYDKGSETVRLGFGNTWGSAYEYLEQFNRLVVGGRAPSVGLATIIGGGLSHLSNKYGFVSDNVVSFELMMPNGTMKLVNATSSPDLFFALKGGSNNYELKGIGIITHATLRTYEVKRVWGGSIIYSNEYRDQLMLAFAAYQRSGQLDRNSALLSYMGINNNTIYVTMIHLNATERPAAFQPFYEIPNVYDGTGLQDNFTAVISQQMDLVVPRWTWGATTFYLDEATYVEVAQICQNATAGLAGINGGTMVLMPQPISTSMISESLARGESPMVSGLTSKAQLWFSINVGWNFASDDSKVEALLLDTFKKIDNMTKKRKQHDQFIFQNDAFSTQNTLISYGKKTFDRLQKVSREVDPDRMFQRLVPGGFKIGV
ncbi:6-hydroxy-D-nicotine oxidase protein [Rutstroemia sp. NJR-2017a BVV2]|nr:6-hydroxy-D-nicotine oxidase protein [Rutstroemia sp. NJR-2017a BVV2]PQE18378.1 6-hydroxy-D-nicotine oxidase protein [Rutstroemia sp. NJR-2017a BVV2]